MSSCRVKPISLPIISSRSTMRVGGDLLDPADDEVTLALDDEVVFSRIVFRSVARRDLRSISVTPPAKRK